MLLRLIVTDKRFSIANCIARCEDRAALSQKSRILSFISFWFFLRSSVRLVGKVNVFSASLLTLTLPTAVTLQREWQIDIKPNKTETLVEITVYKFYRLPIKKIG